MENRVFKNQAGQYVEAHSRKKQWLKVVTVLAAVVVFCTTYALIMPAVTMQRKTFCGYEEHKEHSDKCFAQTKVLSCTLTEEGHQHTDACYAEERTLTCTMEETEGHQHTDECWSEEQILVCEDTSPEHVHDESCYAVRKELTCTTAERPEHHHNENCYAVQRVLVCDKEEQAPHQHTDECYTVTVDAEHPACNLPVHVHTLQCYSNPEADVESAEDWEQTFDDVELTGNWAGDTFAIAETQLGYTESQLNYEVQSNGTSKKGYTRYGAWYGIPYGDWCAMFCSFCLNYAGVDTKLMPRDANCPHWIETLSQERYDLYRPAHNEKTEEEKEKENEDNEAETEEEKYVPQPGDLIFFDWDSYDPQYPERRSADHIGLVAELVYDDRTDAPVKIRTIEGNSGDCVRYNTYDWNDSRILGYGIVPENPDREDKFELTAYTDDGVGVMLTGAVDDLPFPAKDITLRITKVLGTNTVAQVSQAAEADGLSADNLYLFDITLWHDGEEIEPTGNVVVTFLNVCDDGESASVYHVDPDAGVTTNMDAVTEDGNAVIDTDHFSIYGVVVSPDTGKKVSGTGSIDWNSETGTISSFTVTASSSEVEKAYFYVQYSDDGTNWTSGAGPSAQTGKGNEATLDATALIGNSFPVNRQYRAYVYKDNNNSGYSTYFTLSDLFEQVKPGFAAWLTNDYVQNFGGTQPQTQGELTTAFVLYESLPTAVIESGLQDFDGIHKLMVDASLDKALTGLTYVWEYLDRQTGEWTSLTTETGAHIDVTDLAALNGGTDVRCKVYNGSTLLTVSNVLTVNNSLDVLKTSVTVTKKWAGYLVNKPSAVTVRLYQNGTEIDDAELSEANGWTYRFNSLPYQDENDVPYVYTVSEDPLTNFVTTYSSRQTVSDTSAGTHYLQSNALQSGASYAMVGGGYLIGGNGSLSVSSAEVSDEAVSYDGIAYAGEATNVPAQGGTWTVTVNPNGTCTFKCGDSYLAVGSDGKLSLSNSAGTAFSVDENGYISAVAGGKTRYLKASNQGLQASDKSNDATAFTFYQAVNVLGAYDRYAYEITNTGELPNETSVTVKKKWTGYKSGRPDSITVRLYRNGIEEDSVILSEENSWTYVFDELPYQDNNGEPYVYTVSEDAVEGFNATVSEPTVIPDATKGTHYLQEEALQSGASYAMVGGGYVIGGNGSSLTGTSAHISADVTYDGVAYASEVTNVPAEGSVWTVTANSDGTYMLRCGTYYLAMNKDGNPYLSTEPVSGQATTSFRMDGNGRISGIVGDKGSTKYIKVTTKNGSLEKLSGTDNSSDATAFAFYKAQNVLGSHDRYQYKITNRSANEPEPPTVKYGKYIDYLGDKATNPDTDLTGSFYRQYLDVEVTGEIAYDFLFVVDNTSSMLAKDLDGKNAKQRDQIVCEILNGTYTSTSKESGLLTQVLRANPDNKIAVATFCGISSGGDTYNEMLNGTQPEVHTVLDWCGIDSTTNLAPYADVLYNEGGGTCYAEGLLWAEEMMQDPVLDDGNAKIVIFLGDGEPNGVLLNENGEVASPSELADKDSIYFNWIQIGDWRDYLAMCIDGTVNAMDYFIEATEGMEGPGQEQVELYTIAVGTDFDDAILATMAEMGMGVRYKASSIETLNAAFTDIISRYLFTNLVITDDLSQYDEVYKDQLDLRVTRVDHGVETVIWQGDWDDSGNIGSAVNGGDSYIQSVTIAESTAEDSTGTVTVTFQPTYIMEPGVKYVVSYNLKTTQTAEDEFAENGYGSTEGEPDTDYPGNGTSSGRPGFHSNKSAKVTYQKGSVQEECIYPHPVIQATSDKVTPPQRPPEIDPPELDDTATIEKQIDWLGDSMPGMDELYRLYLNLDVDAWPIDLLLIVDESGSMLNDVNGNEKYLDPYEGFDYDEETWEFKPPDDWWIDDPQTGERTAPPGYVYDEDYGWDWDWDSYPDGPLNPDCGKSRIDIIDEFLNGTQSDHTDGFIYNFLNAGCDNMLAVMTFADTSNIEDNYLRQWTDTETGITLDAIPYGTTNYMAALEVADQIWEQHPDNGHQKLMIFLSDGVPTIAYRDGHLHAEGEEDRSMIGYGGEYNGYKSIQETFNFITTLIYYTSDLVIDDFTGSVTYNASDADTFPVMIHYSDLVIDVPGVDPYPYGELTNDGADFINWYETVWEQKTDQEKLQWLQDNLRSYTYYDLFWLSENCFADFVKKNSDVVTYSIGFSSDLLGTLESGRDRSEVLQYMAGSDNYFYCASSDSLAAVINKITGLSGVRITDPLSEYVELTGAPELEITMTLGDGDSAREFTLFEDGAYTQYGQAYLDMEATGFDENGTLHVVYKPGIMFYEHFYCEASFNVQLTEAAYQQWRTNGYTVSGDAISGDANTDHDLVNPTSSNRPGLYSNDDATAEWKHNGDHEEHYPDPVVQVTENRSIRLAKSSMKERSLVLGGAGFDLYIDCDADDDGAVAIPGCSGKYGIKVNTETLVTKSIAEGGELAIPNLEIGHYYLVETVTPIGFLALEAPVEFDLSLTGITTTSEYAVVTDEDPMRITVLNEGSYELPETGGTGTIPYTLCGFGLMAVALMYGFSMRRKRERRYER